jgi:hypothetical protein
MGTPLWVLRMSPLHTLQRNSSGNIHHVRGTVWTKTEVIGQKDCEEKQERASRCVLMSGKTHRSQRWGLPQSFLGKIVVGARGFEPPTSCSQSRRATGLRYAPTPVVELDVWLKVFWHW